MAQCSLRDVEWALRDAVSECDDINAELDVLQRMLAGDELPEEAE